MIRKLISTASLLLILSLFSGIRAQDYNHEIALSMGRFTPTRIETWTNYALSIAEDIFEGMIYLFTWESVNIGDDVDIDDITYSGGLFMDYHNIINEDIVLGGSFGYEKNTSKLSGDVNGTYAIVNYTFAFEGDFLYLSKPKFRMYSGGGLGLKIQNHSYKPRSGFKQSHNDFEPALHLCLLGLSFGEDFSFIMEYGLGYKGVFNFGFSFPLE